LAAVKMNLCAMPASLIFRVCWNAVAGAIWIDWGASTTLSADALLQAANAPPEDKSAGDEAEEFLLELLGSGGKLVTKIQVAAKAAGIAWRTLERAKYKLGVRSYRPNGFNGPWGWELPVGRHDPSPSILGVVPNNNGVVQEERRSTQTAKTDVHRQDRHIGDDGGLPLQSEAAYGPD
jgi:hypothetical protein